MASSRLRSTVLIILILTTARRIPSCAQYCYAQLSECRTTCIQQGYPASTQAEEPGGDTQPCHGCIHIDRYLGLTSNPPDQDYPLTHWPVSSVVNHQNGTSYRANRLPFSSARMNPSVKRLCSFFSWENSDKSTRARQQYHLLSSSPQSLPSRGHTLQRY